MNENPSYPKLLIASTQILDENFEKTVILLTEHDKNGALGFVINRKTDFDLSSIIEDETTSIPRNVPVWYGGPVECESGYILAIEADHMFDQNTQSSDTYHKLAKGITLSTDTNELHGLASQHNQQGDFIGDTVNPRLKFIIGYAGWGPGQLEQELRDSLWIEAAMDKSLLLNTPIENMWESAFKRIGIPNPSMFTSGSTSSTGSNWLN